MEPQSHFERPMFLYFLFFHFRTSNFHVWRHSVDNTYPRFRARDPFLHPDPQLMRLSRVLKEKRPLYKQRHDNSSILRDEGGKATISQVWS